MTGPSGFDVDQLIADCQEAIAEGEPRRAIREVLDRSLAQPDAVAAAFNPTEGGINVLHADEHLTVLHVVWAPGMSIYPHDHRIWAAIGIYTGQEDNAFYRRDPANGNTLVGSGGKQLVTGDTVLLGDDTIHGVTNPLRSLAGAIHVYGGDFLNQPRSQWGPGPLEERPYDIDEARLQFSRGNDAWRASATS